MSTRTLARLEGGESVQMTSFIRVLRALDLLQNLESVVPDAGPSPLDQLRAQRRGRKRASTRGGVRESAQEWRWGDEAASDHRRDDG